MKAREIRNMKPEDLEKRLSESRLELSKELAGVKMGRAVKNPGRIKTLRKTIAKMLTIKKESQFSAQDAKAKPTTSKPAKKKAGEKTVKKPVNRKKS